MPQLNPAPWLAILILTWLVFTIIIPPKILAHQTTNKPAPKNIKSLKPLSWNWLWQ